MKKIFAALIGIAVLAALAAQGNVLLGQTPPVGYVLPHETVFGGNPVQGCPASKTVCVPEPRTKEKVSYSSGHEPMCLPKIPFCKKPCKGPACAHPRTIRYLVKKVEKCDDGHKCVPMEVPCDHGHCAASVLSPVHVQP